MGFNIKKRRISRRERRIGRETEQRLRKMIKPAEAEESIREMQKLTNKKAPWRHRINIEARSVDL